MIKLKMRSVDLDMACGFDEYIIGIKNRLEKII